MNAQKHFIGQKKQFKLFQKTEKNMRETPSELGPSHPDAYPEHFFSFADIFKIDHKFHVFIT